MLVGLDGTNSKSGVNRATSCTRFVHTQENFIVQPGKRMLSSIPRFRSRNKITNSVKGSSYHIKDRFGKGRIQLTYICTSTCTTMFFFFVLISIDHVAFSPKTLFTDGKSLSYTDRGQSFPLPRPSINQVVYTYYP